MIKDLDADGFKVSLWQLPYFTPQNKLFQEVVDNYAVKDNDGQLPTGDAIIDYSDPAAFAWYQGLLANLLKMGVAAIKVDFGEAAPVEARYASGASGRYEHNRYPVRYQQAVYDITRDITGDGLFGQPGPAGRVANVFPFTGAATPKAPIKDLLPACAPACPGAERLQFLEPRRRRLYQTPGPRFVLTLAGRWYLWLASQNPRPAPARAVDL